MFDDVLRTSTMTEPTTSRGTQLASWITGVGGLPMSENNKNHIQIGNLEGT